MKHTLKQDRSIGGNLRRLRKQNNLSQEAVAAKLQVLGLPISREMVCLMELGRCNIRVSVLLALKGVYRVSSFDEFFEGL